MAVHCWQGCFTGEFCGARSVTDEEPGPLDQNSINPLGNHPAEGAGKLGGAAYTDVDELEAKRPSRPFRLSYRSGVAEMVRVPEDNHPGQAGDGLFEEMKLLPDEIGGHR